MPVPQFITSVGAHSVVKTGLTSKDNSVFDCNTFRRICHRNLCGIGSIYYQLTQTHDVAGGNLILQNIPANIICINSDQTPTPTKKHMGF